jgi:hypothetical protein
MKMKVLAVAAACALAAATAPAEARPSFDHNGALTWSDRYDNTSYGKRGRSRASRYSGDYTGGLGPRPRRWCGWWMRSQRGGGPHLNVAWNWSRWGSPTVPQIGAVVVWRHHVGEIVGQAANGMWIVRSGNDGGAVRTRARSVAGAVFRI